MISYNTDFLCNNTLGDFEVDIMQILADHRFAEQHLEQRFSIFI